MERSKYSCLDLTCNVFHYHISLNIVDCCFVLHFVVASDYHYVLPCFLFLFSAKRVPHLSVIMLLFWFVVYVVVLVYVLVISFKDPDRGASNDNQKLSLQTI